MRERLRNLLQSKAEGAVQLPEEMTERRPSLCVQISKWSVSEDELCSARRCPAMGQEEWA